mmetsp:Transcript_27134/g.76647  ORF Transcript_27134/g.76647 Transcript_27134/m.76647 type:complete len:450 (+) Transcript_27134:490-1839(+)
MLEVRLPSFPWWRHGTVLPLDHRPCLRLLLRALLLLLGALAPVTLVLSEALLQGLKLGVDLRMMADFGSFLLIQLSTLLHSGPQFVDLLQPLPAVADQGLEVFYQVGPRFARACWGQLCRPGRHVIVRLKLQFLYVARVVVHPDGPLEVLHRQPAVVARRQDHVVLAPIEDDAIGHCLDHIYVNEELGGVAHPTYFAVLRQAIGKVDVVPRHLGEALRLDEWPVYEVGTVNALGDLVTLIDYLQQQIGLDDLHGVALVRADEQLSVKLAHHGVPLLVVEVGHGHQLLKVVRLEIPELHDFAEAHKAILTDAHVELVRGVAEDVGEHLRDLDMLALSAEPDPDGLELLFVAVLAQVPTLSASTVIIIKSRWEGAAALATAVVIFVVIASRAKVLREVEVVVVIGRLERLARRQRVLLFFFPLLRFLSVLRFFRVLRVFPVLPSGTAARHC